MKRRAILIGLGRIGWALEKDKLRYHPCTHAGSLLSLQKRIELVAVCDSNPDQVKSFQRWWPHPVQAFENADELFSVIVGTGKKSPQSANPREKATIRKGAIAFKSKSSGKSKNATSSGKSSGGPAVDLAIVATPQDVHTSQALRLMTLGVSDVLIEKPPGEDSSDMRKLRNAMQSSKSRLWINFERRFHPGYARVRQLIESRSLGELRSVRGRVFSGASPIHPASGPLLHDAVHWIDLLFWYCGLPEKMTGRVLRNSKGLEESSHLQFHYPDFVASLTTGARSRYFEFEMELDFTEGRIHCGNNGFRMWKSKRSKRYSGFLELQEIAFSIPGKEKNPWLQMYAALASASQKPEEYDSQRTLQGLATVDYIHRAYKSL